MTNRLNFSHGSSIEVRKDTALDVLIALILGLGSFVLYLVTLAPTVLFADGGEFQFVPYILGIAHPTGYPLYLLLGWAWSHALPIGDVAYRMNLFSALWAASAVGLSYLVALRFIWLGAAEIDSLIVRLSAATAALTFAVGETFWSQAIIAEVYSFNAFFVALVLLLLFWLAECLVDGKGRGWTLPAPGGMSALAFRSLVLATVFGLSLTHHSTMLLLLPGILAFLWLIQRSAQSRQPDDYEILAGPRVAAPETRPLGPFAPHSLLRRVGFALALIVAAMAPLLLYLYLPLRAPHTPYNTIQLSESQTLTLYENTWRGLVNHLTASAFAGSFGVPTSGAERILMAWGLLRNQIGWVGTGLALVGLGRLIAGRRWALLALTGLGYGVGVAFNLVYFIGDVHVLFIPSYLFVSLWLSLGVASLAQGVGKGLALWRDSIITHTASRQPGYQPRMKGRFQLAAQAVSLLAVALPVVLLVSHFPVVDQSANTEARDVWQSILTKPIPEGAVLVTNDRDEMMPLWYYQYVQGRRTDLLGLFPLVVSGPTYGNLGGLIDQALLSQRPVYLIKPMPGLEVKAQTETATDMSPLVRVVGTAMDRPPLHPRQVALAGVMRLIGYDQSSPSVRPGESLGVTLYWQPQAEIEHDYSSYVHLVDDAGRGITQSDHQLGGDYYPTSLWRPGEVLRDSHVLTIPQDAGSGVYRLLAGMYQYPSMEPLGGPADIGLLAVKDPNEVQMTLPGDTQSATDAVRRIQVEFGERITLLGNEPEVLDDGLELTLYWQAERPLDQNWTVFVHVVDSDGDLVFQRDSQPRDGRYPTSVWDQGEVVEDRHWLALPSELPDGDYQVVLGLYSVDSDQRLPVLDSEGNPTGDSIALVTLELANGKWQVK